MKFDYELNDAWVTINGQFIDKDYFEIDSIEYNGIDLLPVVSEMDIENITEKAKEISDEKLTEAKIKKWED